MTVKRGGGPKAPKIPQRTPAQAAPNPGDAQSSQTPAGTGEVPALPRELQARGLDADGFEDEISNPVVSATERAEDLAVRGGDRPSALRSSERMLETTRDRLAVELGRLTEQTGAAAQSLAAGGFSAEAVAAKRPELTEQRARIAKLRARLSTIHRRLRTLSTVPGAVADASLKARLGGQVDHVTQLPAGPERTLAALQLSTTFGPRTADGSSTALRLTLKDAPDAALGDQLARQTASAATALLVAQLLATGGSTPGREIDSPTGASDVEQLDRVTQAMLG